MRNTNTNRSKKSTHSWIRNPSTNKREAIRNTCPRSHLSVPPSICLPPAPHPTIPWELLRKVRTLTIFFVLITYWRFIILFESVTKKTRSHTYMYIITKHAWHGTILVVCRFTTKKNTSILSALLAASTYTALPRSFVQGSRKRDMAMIPVCHLYWIHEIYLSYLKH